MAKISQEEIKKIIDSRPAGATPEGIVAGLRARGHELEGYQELSKKQEGRSGVEGFATGFVKSGLSTLQNIGQMVTKPLSKLTGIEDRTGIPEEVLKSKGTAEKVGAFTSEVAQFAIPATKVSKLTKGASALTRIAGQTASDVAVATAQGQGATDVATTGAISATLSSLPLVGKFITPKVAGKIENFAKNLEEMNLRLTPTQKLALKKKESDVISYLTKQKITGTPEVRYEKILNLEDNFENKIQDALKTSKKGYKKNVIINSVKNIPEKYLDEVANPEVSKQMTNLTGEFIDFIKKQKGDIIPATRVNEFKRQYAKNARNKAGDVVVNEAREALADGLYNILQKDIKNLKSINTEYSKVITARKLLGKALGRNEIGLIGNLIGLSAGTAVGGAIGGGVGAGVGALVAPQIGKAVAGTQARSNIGAGLQTFAEYLKTAKTDKAGNLIIPKSIIQSFIGE